MRHLFLSIFFYMTANFSHSQSIQLDSPNQRIKLHIEIGQEIHYAVSFDNQSLIVPSNLSLSLMDGKVLGKDAQLQEQGRTEVRSTITAVIPEKNKNIPEEYNQLTLSFEEGFQLIFRAYDDGIAYRFVTQLDGKIKVKSEEVQFNLADDFDIIRPVETSFLSHQEPEYKHMKVSEFQPGELASSSLLVYGPGDTKFFLAEADLQDYAGLFLEGTGTPLIKGIHAQVPLTYEVKPSGQLKDKRSYFPVTRAEHIAETSGSRSFPWRVIVIAENDKALASNQLVYKLAPELQLEDTDWIRPGKVAWDWYNALNLFGVDFETGINTETYKYYIDFASRYGIEYIILDEGWSPTHDVTKVVPEIDMEELLAYAEEKQVGIILWVVWKSLEEKMEEALDLYEKWGIAGIKVDFMQRDDQEVVNFYWKTAEEAAKRKLLVDFHGSYKPKGIRRAYPHVLTREGLRGGEQNKWSDYANPEHNVTLPFNRQVCGPMDYTPGAMVNAQKDNFAERFTRPMSLGTRCHQLGMYVVYESPLQMLCDAPTLYEQEPEVMEFLGPVPTVWDETIVLEAQVSDYIIVARQHGDDWYLGAMTDWEAREFDVDLSFLGSGNYHMLSFEDGPNAARWASDYKKNNTRVSAGSKVKIKMAPGGGFAARITKH
jgi:alpha-glucosidase